MATTGQAGKCPHQQGDPPLRYNLPGPQVEPDAGFWIDGATPINVPTFDQVKAISEAPQSTPNPHNTDTPRDRLVLDFTSDFPFDPANPTTNKLEAQLDLLFLFADARDRTRYPKKIGSFPLTPLSRFLQLQPVPFGAIFDTAHHTQTRIDNVNRQHERILTGTSVVSEGRELARMFENETPGLYHRHALNWALFNRVDVSPPRHARVWMALDIAIYTALTAAWYYKWLRSPYSLLVRPKEYELCVRGKDDFDVHYDRRVQDDGQDPERPDLERKCPQPTPGTPRHPAWPSGHSTYSAAASHILEYFFSPDTLKLDDGTLYSKFPPDSEAIEEPGWFAAELRRLADNIGHARLWGGVHWVDDHVAGQKIGRSAAEAVIKEIERDCVPKLADPVPPCNSTDRPQVPTGRLGTCEAGQDTIPPVEKRGGAFLQTRGVL